MNENQKNKKFLLIFIFFLLFSSESNSFNFIKKNTIKLNNVKKIEISNETLVRIKGYLKGKFYSPNLNQKFFQVSGVFFAISNNGNNSSISFCNADSFDLCAEQLLAYQTLKKCEKISREKCYLLFRGKVFLPTREKNISIEKYFLIKNQNLGSHADIYGNRWDEILTKD